MPLRFKMLVYFLLFFFCGCVSLGSYSSLMNIKKLGNNRKQIEEYLSNQERLFENLKEDIVAKRLKRDISREEVIETYGEPVLSKRSQDDGIAYYLLYRHPTKYFSSDFIYLYFDNTERLSSWLVKPHAKGG